MATKNFNLDDMFDFPEDSGTPTSDQVPATQKTIDEEFPVPVTHKTEERMPKELNGQHSIVVLCIDKSGSMGVDDSSTGCSRIELVNQQANDMINTNMLDNLDKDKVDMAVISFDDSITFEKDFAPMSEIDADFDMQAEGCTSLYSALIVAVASARKRRNELISQGVDCFKPVIFLLTDGAPTDDEMQEKCRRIMEKYIDKDSDGKSRMSLTIFGWRDLDMSEMQALSPDAKIVALRDTDAIKDVFKLITASMACMSQSTVDDDLHISFDKLKNLGVLKGQSRVIDIN